MRSAAFYKIMAAFADCNPADLGEAMSEMLKDMPQRDKCKMIECLDCWSGELDSLKQAIADYERSKS